MARKNKTLKIGEGMVIVEAKKGARLSLHRGWISFKWKLGTEQFTQEEIKTLRELGWVVCINDNKVSHIYFE